MIGQTRTFGAEMNLEILVGFAFFGLVIGASAAETPTIGRAFNVRENSFVDFSCVHRDEVINCTFNQVSVHKKLADADIKKRLLEGEKEYALNGKNTIKGMTNECEKYRAWLSVANSGKGDKEIVQRYDEATKGQTKEQITDTTQLIATMVSFCDKPNLENWMSIIRKGSDIDNRTCVVSTNPYAQKFRRVHGSDVWTVVQDEGATGQCGIINVSRFELDKSTSFPFWNYFAKKVFTNRTGEITPGFKCTDLDESEYEYNWKKSSKYVGCDYVELGGI